MTPDEFIAVVSHELRGPVAAIGAASQVLEGCDPASDSGREARDVIARQSQKLAIALADVEQLGRLVWQRGGSSETGVDFVALLRKCQVEVADGAGPVHITIDAALVDEALERTRNEAPSSLHAGFEQAKEEAATVFTLEPVGGGFGVQFLRALLERSGAQVRFEQSAKGRRVVARLAD
ncbi:MAG TPA: histidine kinase dimerization/phospho-acceptor domain-containing protein [Ramlibacter sp.]|nr:histidine kinase dimerization/phospho-acceptor domain-containing protein [Ramlibacter sp.]